MSADGDVTDLPDAGTGGHPGEPAVVPIPPGALELDTPTGRTPFGAPTIDSDADGVADTAVVPADGDDLLGLATDLDGDGHVDVLTTIDTTGAARTETVPSPGAWDEGVPPPPPVIDPATGRWTDVAP